MNVGRINGKWVREAGDPVNYRALILMDSQAGGVCMNPHGFVVPTNALVLSISGGSMIDFVDIMNHRVAQDADIVVIGGIGTNNLGRRSIPRVAPPRVVAVSGPRGRRRLEFSGETLNSQAPAATYVAILNGYREIYRRKRSGQTSRSASS